MFRLLENLNKSHPRFCCHPFIYTYTLYKTIKLYFFIHTIHLYTVHHNMLYILYKTAQNDGCLFVQQMYRINSNPVMCFFSHSKNVQLVEGIFLLLIVNYCYLQSTDNNFSTIFCVLLYFPIENIMLICISPNTTNIM